MAKLSEPIKLNDDILADLISGQINPTMLVDNMKKWIDRDNARWEIALDKDGWHSEYWIKLSDWMNDHKPDFRVECKEFLHRVMISIYIEVAEYYKRKEKENG